ncbi:hypothetical protein [Microcystis phage Mwe-JY13]
MTRRSVYSDELARKICALLADGQSLLQICKASDMPNRATVFDWLMDPRYAEFKKMYEFARDVQADSLFDDLLTIADANDEEVNRSRLRIDTRKWAASKLKPKKYGDKVAVVGGGDDDEPIKHSVGLTDEQLAKIALGK